MDGKISERIVNKMTLEEIGRVAVFLLFDASTAISEQPKVRVRLRISLQFEITAQDHHRGRSLPNVGYQPPSISCQVFDATIAIAMGEIGRLQNRSRAEFQR
jgi:hypothetical protein